MAHHRSIRHQRAEAKTRTNHARATSASEAAALESLEPVRVAADDLDDRQVRGVIRMAAAERTNSLAILLDDRTTLWMSKRGNTV